MLAVENLFGGATTSPSGMVNSPLLAGFGAGQNMQDQFTNTGLNQQAQGIQNQAAQHALDQSMLDDPVNAAKRQLAQSDMGVQQSMYDNGQQAAAQSGKFSAQVQAQLSAMSDSEMNFK